MATGLMLPLFILVQKRRKAVLPVVSFIHGLTINTFRLAASGMPMQVLSMACQ
jgi:hypothetical protein